MPTYEYACRECGQHLEVVQSFTDAPLSVCGSCGGALRKVFSAAGIIFKGSGYYVTDTRGKAGKSSSTSSEGDSGGDKGGSGGAKDGSGGSADGTSTASGTKGEPSTSSGEAKSA